MKYPQAIQNLINNFTKLPTVGPKTAERYVFYLLKQSGEDLQKLAQAIAELKEGTKTCGRCFAIAEADPCPICSDKKRDNSVICVISTSRDMQVIEATGQYKGHYHILEGLINTIDNIGPENLTIKQLLHRIKNSGVKEVILGLSHNFEGETTALYLAKILKPLNVKITRLAKGLPMGADLEYADEITLTHALKYRNTL
ncbi:recombination protein RecR [Candidatus Falkowbacteria bacterium RIFOXYB2_FULL_47_14]|uniref:Recombination protein RecR n=1 Tax=Candidatus Falkowbacteria bacterium RIFOXYA2_FULL_47_19 TaxID=1797994 RepID=A0A1F5SMK4_9BACT|nr:MAG: recombination protein RecR [Candidatus Falkowbacteria bacterium RIFOXYA2_FULL_47_19]OGF36040.1 MAG: recombination protein RecR [Candidatus Falkowbacteria bacterium RIFOXYC2_FULL_46_15]OGF43430.1 MAG: recombination protein RecR [Candidatus Falkowbacteria bacterium RIFOXYB2_FULL_47_14]